MNMTAKKWVILYFSTAFLLLSLLWLVRYLTNGQVLIYSNQSASVTITDQQGKDVKEGVTPFAARLKAGTYTAVVQKDEYTTRKLITVKARTTQRYTINLSIPNYPEPVSSLYSQDVVASAISLRFIDRNRSQIVTVGSSNNPVYSEAPEALQHVKWSDTNFGVAQDDSGKLYVVDGQSITKLALPSSGAKTVHYAVTTSRKIYLSLDGAIYQSTDQGSFKKIYQAKSDTADIAASDKHVMVIENSTTGSDHPEHRAELTLLSDTGEVIASDSVTAGNDLGAQMSVNWSPDAEKILITNGGGSFAAIYDNDFTKIQTLPESIISSVAWLDDDQLVYASDSSVWLYDTKSESSKVVAQITGNTGINELAVSSDKKQIYVITNTNADGSPGGGLFRFTLEQEKHPGVLDKLSVFLPTQLDLCGIDFINFSAPTIVLMPYNSGDINPCRTQALQTLQDDEIDTSELSITVGPVLTHVD